MRSPFRHIVFQPVVWTVGILTFITIFTITIVLTKNKHASFGRHFKLVNDQMANTRDTDASISENHKYVPFFKTEVLGGWDRTGTTWLIHILHI